MQDHAYQTPTVIPEATIHPTVMPEQTEISMNVNRPMKFVPSFYKVILGEAEDGWLADEVTSLYLN